MKVALTLAGRFGLPPSPGGYGYKIPGFLYNELSKMVNLDGYSNYLEPDFPNVKPWSSREEEIPVKDYDAILNISNTKFSCNNVVNYELGFAHTKNVVVISQQQADACRSGLYPQLLHRNPKVIYYGTDTDLFRFNPNKEDYFVFFARIHPSKGALMAVEIAKRTGIKLKVMGEDKNPSVFGVSTLEEWPKSEPFRWIENLKQECSKYPNIEYIGSVWPHEKVVDILGRAKASIYPIQGQFQFDQTVIETLSCGTPVLVSNIPAPCELVDEGVTGFILPQYDLDAWAAAIRRVNELDPYKVRQVAETKWSAKRMAQEFVPLLEMVARGETW